MLRKNPLITGRFSNRQFGALVYVASTAIGQVIFLPLHDGLDGQRVFLIPQVGKAAEFVGVEAARLKVAHWADKQQSKLGKFSQLEPLIGTGDAQRGSQRRQPLGRRR